MSNFRCATVEPKIDKTVEYCICTHRVGYQKQGNWWVCGCCLKPSKLLLNECDLCGILFKGNKPMRIAFTCTNCEEFLRKGQTT